MDDPLPIPMFGAARARGKTNTGASNMTEAFTALAGSLAEVISPKQANSDSPTKAVDLRGKYIQQLKELVNLGDIDVFLSISNTMMCINAYKYRQCCT